MGRPRVIQDEDRLVINMLTWCGEHLEPLGFGSVEDWADEDMDREEYDRIRAEKIANHDQSLPGETDTPRRPHGSIGVID